MSTQSTIIVGTQPNNTDRINDLKAFDEAKTGVKGLVDAGTKALPSIFIRPPEDRSKDFSTCSEKKSIPVIDFAHVGEKSNEPTAEIVKEISWAAEKWGFFQVINHGIPLEFMQKAIQGARLFHEQDAESKKQYYSRDPRSKQVTLVSNHDLYQSIAADWRDTLSINTIYGDGKIDPHELPPICKDITLEYVDHILKLGEKILMLLSLGLGLKPEYFADMDIGKGWSMLYHYHPPCPNPELTLGTSEHTDVSFITILSQDQIGGIQILHDNEWVNVQPIPGALLVNIGDALQMASNDKFKSVVHRAIAQNVGPRVSIAFFFFDLLQNGKKFGPIKELISKQNPPIYKDFTLEELLKYFYSKSLKELRIEQFKLSYSENTH